MIGASNCGGCVCDSCANSVELPVWYFTPGECAEPCFSCDECRHYDGDTGKRSQRRENCPRYIEAKKHAEHLAILARRRDQRAKAIRASFKVIKGGGGHV